MINSKLIEIIRALDAAEMKRLDAFLRSPYFQADIASDELELFDLLYQQHPDFTDAELEKGNVFRQLYPDSAFVKGRLEKKMSYLLKRVEHFMSQEEMAHSQHEFPHQLNITRFYRRKKLVRLYEISLANLRKEQDNISKKGPDDLLHEFFLQQEITEHQSLYNTRKKDINLVNALQSLDEFYLVSKLEYSCGLLSQNTFHNQVDLQDSLLFLEKIEPLLSREAFTKVPLIKAYVHIFLILRKMKVDPKPDFEAYLELEQLLRNYEAQIPLKPLKAFHAFCRSFYTHHLNKGNLELQEKIFSLYKEHLEKGFLYYEGGLTPSVYKNTVSIGLRLKKYDWVFTFLEDFKGRIVGTNFPQDVYHLNLAKYYFQLKDYEKARIYLVDTYDDLYYQIAAKRLEVKIYFEENSELLESKIEAFRLFLRRLSKKLLLESARQANNNFINAVKQIYLPKTYKNTKRINSLREKISAIAMIKEKEWLLEKLEMKK